VSGEHPIRRYLLVGALLGVGLAIGGGFSIVHGYLGPSTSKQANAATVSAQEADYTCPMHHQVHSKHPGSCPICGMTLIKRASAASLASPRTIASKAAAPASTAAMPAGLQEIALSPEQQVVANVATEPVDLRPLTALVTAAGQITYDEARLSQVAARVDGRIERLYVNSTGASLRRGSALGTIYSPDLVSSMQEYLIARDSFQQAKDTSYPEFSSSASSLLSAARQRLLLLGVTPDQIAHLERTRMPSTSLPIIAPVSGTVLKKQVVPGQYVKTGDPLFSLADLSRVWVEADVFESQMKNVKVGSTIQVACPAYPGRTFTGKVSFIYPYLSPETRTVKVRAELPNEGGLLKPDMFVTANIGSSEDGAPQLAVPASAVLSTGRRQIVYVEARLGVFRPREVRLGAKSGRYYPVISGLERGEKVATSGGFLLDANSQLQSSGMADMPGMDMPKASPHAASKAPADSMPGMKM